MKELTKNEIKRVIIDGYNSEAMGVCHIDGRAVFVPRAILGEEWDIRIVKVSKNAIFARGENLVHPSPARAEIDCKCYGKCGGCDTRHMCYEEELRFKLDRVNSALKRIGKQIIQANCILPSDRIDHYRNKGIFAVTQLNGDPAYGFYKERSHELVPVEHCLLQSELSCRTAATVVEFLRENSIPAYDELTGKGSVRHIFCRQAIHSAEAVACIISASGFGAKTAALVDTIRKACPELSGIVLNINKSRGNTVLAGDFYTLWGNPCIKDRLCNLRFEIAPKAFYQINPPQAEKLYEKAMEYADLKKEDLALDLYCGAGTISLRMARDAGYVIGAEIVPEAIENAKKNASRNEIDNVEFICSDAGQAAQQLTERGLHPEVIVIDPPRKGIEEQAISAIASMHPQRIVYVSCDPSTLARDILRLNSYDYTLHEAEAVDMFPRTAHIETVCLLTHNG